MIKIVLLKKELKNMQEFAIREWAFADKAHYGTMPEWQENKFYFQAKEGKEITGILVSKLQLGVYGIDQVLVHHNNYRKSIGRMLMEYAEKHAKEQNAHKIYLLTGADWDAVKFYKALGYKKESDVPRHFLKKDFISLVKYLK